MTSAPGLPRCLQSYNLKMKSLFPPFVILFLLPDSGGEPVVVVPVVVDAGAKVLDLKINTAEKNIVAAKDFHEASSRWQII